MHVAVHRLLTRALTGLLLWGHAADFGMMGTIPSDVRGGLLELFYGVYQKDPDRCIDALVAMGVLVPGGDRTAVRRTAEFFLTSFQARSRCCSR